MRLISKLAEKFQGQKNLADAATTFVVRVLSAVMAFGVQVFLARTLEISEYGIYVTFWTWLIVANHIATFGFSESSIRFLPRYTHRRKFEWANGFLATGYRVVILGSLLIGAAGICFLAFAGNTLPPAYLLPAIILLFGLPFTAIELYLEGVSRSFGWFLLTIVPSYVLRPLVIAAGVLSLVLMGYKPDASIVLGIAVAITAVSVIVQSLIIRSRLRKLYNEAETTKPKKLWFIASLPLGLTLIADEIFTWSDILILGFMASPDQISVYFAAHRAMSLAAFVQFAFMLVMARDFSVANATRDKVELQRSVSSGSNWTLWLTVPSVLVTLAAGYPLLWMFGPEYLDGYGVMAVIGLGYIVRATVGQAQDLMIVLGHQKANVMISLGCFLLNVVLSILLIPHYGIMGAAVSTAIAYAMRSVAFAYAVQKLAGLNILARIPGMSLATSLKTTSLTTKGV